jgi:hypothetical protein
MTLGSREIVGCDELEAMSEECQRPSADPCTRAVVASLLPASGLTALDEASREVDGIEAGCVIGCEEGRFGCRSGEVTPEADCWDAASDRVRGIKDPHSRGVFEQRCLAVVIQKVHRVCISQSHSQMSSVRHAVRLWDTAQLGRG